VTALNVACPTCHAKPGIHCKRPSGHRVFGGGAHASREKAVAAGSGSAGCHPAGDGSLPSRTFAWTSCADGLPDSDTTVLIYSAESEEPVWLGFHNGSGWCDIEGYNLEEEVTHWADLPEPPSVATSATVARGTSKGGAK
jgi:hypothetical protein